MVTEEFLKWLGVAFMPLFAMGIAIALLTQPEMSVGPVVMAVLFWLRHVGRYLA